MLLLRSPRVGAMGPEEAKAFGREYYTAAIGSLLHWAEVCKGKTLVILTDTWPLPGSIEDPVSPVNQMLWSEEFLWHWLHHPKFFRRWHRRQELLSSGNVHRIIGRILERHGIVCETHLFTSRGVLTRLPDPDPHRWPNGW